MYKVKRNSDGSADLYYWGANDWVWAGRTNIDNAGSQVRAWRYSNIKRARKKKRVNYFYFP